MTITIGNPRRDGKFPVSLHFAGAPNAFGGYYPGRTFNKLYTLEQVREAVAKSGTPQQRARFGVPEPQPEQLQQEAA